MIMNMVRGFLVDLVIVLLFSWLLSKMAVPSFGTIVASAVAVGIISFLSQPYIEFIWYKSFDIWAYVLDAVLAWGLIGVWPGWWLRRGRLEMSAIKFEEREKELA